MVFDLRRLQQRLENHPPVGLYLLVGDESFLVQEAFQLIKKKTVEESIADFNVDVFDAGDTPTDRVRDAVETLPMMSPRRFVGLRGVERLKDKDWEVLYPLIDNPLDTSTFVLTCDQLDKRKKPFKKLGETGVVVELKRPYENQLGDWIDYLAHRHELKVTRDASAMLRQFVGTNLSELNSEILKLKDFISPRTQVIAEDVMQSVAQSRIDRIFDLTDAIGRRDRAQALVCLANLLEQGQSEVGALAMIQRHFRILSKIKEGVREGLGGGRLCARAGVPQFLLTQYVEQARLWDEGKIQEAFGLLLDTDRALKSSTVPSHVWLENFVMQTC